MVLLGEFILLYGIIYYLCDFRDLLSEEVQNTFTSLSESALEYES